MDTILSLTDVCYRYEGAEKFAVDHVSLTVNRGEFLCVLGRNGSGKSTLAKLFNALLMPESGEVKVAGTVIRDEDTAYTARKSCGMVFQNPDNQLVATITEEDVAFGLENTGVPTAEIRARVDEALRRVGMAEYALSAPHMLSGGQKQRVAIAGVIALRPDIIVFDEATAMLDPSGRRDILNIVTELNKKHGITVIWITHFMDEALLADRMYIMSDGRIVREGKPRDVFSDSRKMRALGLEAPAIAEYAEVLRAKGIRLDSGIMTAQEMAVALCR